MYTLSLCTVYIVTTLLLFNSVYCKYVHIGTIATLDPLYKSSLGWTGSGYK